MDETAVIEGSGAEIARYAQDHADQRFRLLVVEKQEPKKRGGPDAETMREILEFRRSLRGKMGILPLEATSTEALYGLTVPAG